MIVAKDKEAWLNFLKARPIEKFTSLRDLGVRSTEYMICGQCLQIGKIEDTNDYDLFVIKPEEIEALAVDDSTRHIFACKKCIEDERNPIICSGCNTKLKRSQNHHQVQYTLNGATHQGINCDYCHQYRRFHSSYLGCQHCGNYDARDNFVVIEEGPNICANCMVHTYYFCEDCQDYHKKQNKLNGIPKPGKFRIESTSIDTLLDAQYLGLTTQGRTGV